MNKQTPEIKKCVWKMITCRTINLLRIFKFEIWDPELWEAIVLLNASHLFLLMCFALRGIAEQIKEWRQWLTLFICHFQRWSFFIVLKSLDLFGWKCCLKRVTAACAFYFHISDPFGSKLLWYVCPLWFTKFEQDRCISEVHNVRCVRLDWEQGKSDTCRSERPT